MNKRFSYNGIAYARLLYHTLYYEISWLESSAPAGGIGLMNMICEWADDKHVHLALNCGRKKDDPSYEQKLIKFYQHFGFEGDGGGCMARIPRSNNERSILGS